MTNSKSKIVLVFDGETRSSLAVTRSLGNAGYTVIVGCSEFKSLAGSSKFCSCTIRYPDIATSPTEFKKWIFNILKEVKPDFLIPTTDLTLTELSNYQDEISKYTVLPISKESSIKNTQDKFEILNLAKTFGINCPKTFLINKENIKDNDLSDKLINEIGFPIVFKARVSVQTSAEGSSFKPPLKYAKNNEELRDFLSSQLPIDYEYIAQAYIKGEGRGLFILIKDKQNVANFSHKRILEKPPEGGVSVLSESIKTDLQLMEKCESLLSSLNWNGMAMLEFKYTTDSKYYLMEINPRFWGSLQLSIDSGVNFPKILLSENVNTQEKEYKVGVKLRWELGLLDHFFIQLKRMKLNLLSAMIFKNYFQFFKSNTKNEIFRISDFGPFKFELTKYFKSLKR